MARVGPPTATVHGQVRSEGSSAPLRGAVVEIVSASVSMQVASDSAGNYVLKNVPVGRRMLRATHIDHAPLEVEVIVTEKTDLVLDFALELRPVKLPAITAHAMPWSGIGDTLGAGTAALGQASVRVLEATPGMAEIGLAEISREVPGPEPPDPSDVLYVRGGTTDLKLVLLNGAPVYAPFHLGGLINPLDGDLMRAAKLYVGGAPARYDGGLSYVMDLETRAGRTNQAHASLGFDLLSSRTVLEGPIGTNASYLVGARSVHGMGTKAFVGPHFPYGYADAIGRLDFDVAGGRLTLAGFWNQESVQLDSVGGGRAEAEWGNTSGSARLRANILGENVEFTLAAGRFHTTLPVGIVRPIVTEGIADRVRISAHFSHSFSGGNVVQYGGTFDQQAYQYRAWPRFATRDSLLLRAHAGGDIAGFYVDGQWQPTKRLSVRSGARADLFSQDRSPRLAPRIAATYLLNDKAALTVAAGQYRQYVRFENGSGIIGTPLPDSGATPALAIAKASHLVLSLDQDLGEGVRVALEGYYKAFEDLPSTHGELTEASGLDLWVRRASGRLTGWLGYSLAWIWSLDDAGTLTSTRVFAGRQLLSAGASGMLGANGKFDVRIAYGAGLPFTAIPEPEATPPVFSIAMKPGVGSIPDDNGSYPSTPDEQYLRVDAQIARTFITDVYGFAFELTPYFKVLNALDRRDALFYHLDRSQQEPQARAVGALPVLPVIGFEWRF